MTDHITRLRALADAHARMLGSISTVTKPAIPVLKARLAAEAQALLAGAAALEREAEASRVLVAPPAPPEPGDDDAR